MSDRDLFWNVASYQDWKVPLRKNAPTLNSAFDLSATNLTTDAEGNKRLCLFTSCETYENFHAEGNLKLEGTTGAEIFRHDLPGVVEVFLDRASDHECSFDPDIFPYLKVLAEGIAIERLWDSFAQGIWLNDSELDQLARYSGYHIVGVETENGVESLQVPHDDGRYFFPIFTHPHGLQLALEELQKSHPEEKLRALKIAGTDLFHGLAEEKPDGFVMNFRGPGEPIGLKAKILDLMHVALQRGERN